MLLVVESASAPSASRSPWASVSVAARLKKEESVRGRSEEGRGTYGVGASCSVLESVAEVETRATLHFLDVLRRKLVEVRKLRRNKG